MGHMCVRHNEPEDSSWPKKLEDFAIGAQGKTF